MLSYKNLPFIHEKNTTKYEKQNILTPFKAEPIVHVGILQKREIELELIGNFTICAINKLFSGSFLASISEQQIVLKQHDEQVAVLPEISFTPQQEKASFVLHKVSIGIDFHWQKEEVQEFEGSLKLICEGNKIWAINQIALEKYLKSVISSEMSANASLEFLKSHAVISRSWLLAQIVGKNTSKKAENQKSESENLDKELIKWYDKKEHTLFDVCADDHCQRYQGITKIKNRKAMEAVCATRGEVLVSNNEICDTRFSKCCGGISEQFENVWQNQHFPYLTKVIDSNKPEKIKNTKLKNEKEVENWIKTSPDVFCNTNDRRVLKQILSDFDQKTSDFFRWKQEYSQKEIQTIICNKSGIDFGEICDLVPVERGVSGRLIKLKIVGTKTSLTIGKELEIRRILSASHLYSSAFIVEKGAEKNGVPEKFCLKGAGWGHGVGLCQIGAAVMGEKGYKYEKILKHYFLETEIFKLY